jgi:hypothetical protein
VATLSMASKIIASTVSVSRGSSTPIVCVRWVRRLAAQGSTK